MQHRQLLACSLAGLLLLQPLQGAFAQQVEPLNVSGPPPDLSGEKTSVPAGQAAEAIDLGQASSQGAGSTVAGMSVPAPLAAAARGSIARSAAAQATLRRVGPAPLSGTASGPAERTVFAREPVRVNLTVGQERLVTLPSDALLHVPSDISAVARIESIGGTIYVTALVPFVPIRIVAELVDSGQQIPMDLVAVADKPARATSKGELQVSVIEPGSVPNPSPRSAEEVTSAAAGAGIDMVQLTRHAARQLYAPRRLANAAPGVMQVAVSTDPVPALLRGAHVDAAPVGQWKGGALYVTAVRITNKSRFALEVPLESVRGRWIAATAQHGRLGPAGSDTDTTAIYLVCERSFESCL
ncbi:integrating conjugative element protein [Delftia acidovorans CCUG 274B]|uniref:TIGR03749 family integrating conjugative element protein n=1 Tax=Delftia TaxID=80865 RepID=UPI00035403EE|nr:TIGR03749 family integrating conjugative element protein [Delftia acidovorans]EPD42964.1 integrating conjugative element protein [Delftia acidovorans CCUG 274B]